MKVVLFSMIVLSWLVGEANAQRLEDAVVFIRVGTTDPISQSRRELTSGSGFLIDRRGHIITARHVVQHREAEDPGPRWITVSLRDRDALPLPAQLVGCESPSIDMCLIKVSDSSVAAANITDVFVPVCRHLTLREAIVAYGYPFGRFNPVLIVPGSVTGNIGEKLKNPSNVQIVPNMSGGPVLDSQGFTIALNVGAAANFPTFSFLQPLIYGEPLIRRAGISCSATGLSPPSNTPANPHRFEACSPAISESSGEVRLAVVCRNSAAEARVQVEQNLEIALRRLRAVALGQRYYLLPSFEAYIVQPSEVRWAEVRRQVGEMLDLIQTATRSVIAYDAVLSDEVGPNLSELHGVLRARTRLLVDLPLSPPGAERANNLMNEYRVLFVQLLQEIERLRSRMPRQG